MANKYRNFSVVLYPDCDDHLEGVKALADSGVDYRGILHDRDVLDDGTPKKPHWHIRLSYPNPVSVDSVAKLLRCEPNLIQIISNRQKQIALRSTEANDRYVTHIDHPDKAQYSAAEAFGALASAVAEACEKTIKTAERGDDLSKVKAVLAYLDNDNCSWRGWIEYCIDNDCWDVLRRGSSVWAQVYREEKVARAEQLAGLRMEIIELTKELDDYKARIRDHETRERAKLEEIFGSLD